MKARIKATGEIVDVTRIDNRYVMPHHPHTITFERDELDFNIDEPDYWTRLGHQYAGMAMQGLMTILPNIGGLEGRTPKDEIVDIAIETAHALVEKMKEERK
jgi:hypothetical protein